MIWLSFFAIRSVHYVSGRIRFYVSSGQIGFLNFRSIHVDRYVSSGRRSQPGLFRTLVFLLSVVDANFVSFRSAAPLPCKDCCNVIFCSIECRDLATSTYHKFECGILKLLWNSGSSINCHMALRMISQKSPNYFQDIKEQLTDVKFEDTLRLEHSFLVKLVDIVSWKT